MSELSSVATNDIDIMKKNMLVLEKSMKLILRK